MDAEAISLLEIVNTLFTFPLKFPVPVMVIAALEDAAMLLEYVIFYHQLAIIHQCYFRGNG